MGLPRIMCFSGRKRSGKTELAQVCLKYGYTMINFADSLKKLVCCCLDISCEELEKLKDVEQIWNLSDKSYYLSKELDISEMLIKIRFNKPFSSIREILQVLGTDIIRRYNPEWHIKKTVVYIETNKDKLFCIGDCRFLNEKRSIEKLDGECWFIMRPNMMEISNHISETELNWSLFKQNRIIINDSDKDELINKFNDYLNKNVCNVEIDCIFNNNYLCNFGFLYSTNRNSYLAGFLSGCNVLLHDNKLVIKHGKILRITDLKNELANTYKIDNIDTISIYNSYIIENLKLWNIFIGTTTASVPCIIKSNINYLKCWIVGFIDSKGIVKLSNGKLVIEICGSMGVLQYILEQCNIQFSIFTCGVICKGIFKNDKSLEFIEWLGNDIIDLGLVDNWGKIILKNH